jgi:hypothetical protein
MIDDDPPTSRKLARNFWGLHITDNSIFADRLDGVQSKKYFPSAGKDDGTVSKAELSGFLNGYISRSSSHYGGFLPLSAKSQEGGVMVQSSNQKIIGTRFQETSQVSVDSLANGNHPVLCLQSVPTKKDNNDTNKFNNCIYAKFKGHASWQWTQQLLRA